MQKIICKGRGRRMSKKSVKKKTNKRKNKKVINGKVNKEGVQNVGKADMQDYNIRVSVSYTHLTLPTMATV